MAEFVESGIETCSMQSVLGMDDGVDSTSETYKIVTKAHGTKSGLKYDSVCITPAAEHTYDEVPEKTVQVLYTKDAEQHGGLSYATIAIYETPKKVDESVTVSRIVHLRSSKKTTVDSGRQEEEGVFASDADTQNSIRFGPTTDEGATNKDVHEDGIFASDPEALKFIKFGTMPGATGASSSNGEPEGVFASDPEALKFIKFGPKLGATGASSNDEPEGVFASDPEALKFIKFGTRPGATGASSNDEQEGVFASDPEALKFIRFGPKLGATGASSNDEQEGVFASDPEALKYIKLVPKPARSEAVCKIIPETHDGEGDLLAEATGFELKDDRTYSVRVTGHDLPDGQRKKFVSVRSADNRGGLTPEEIDRLEVKVETSIGEDGMVEKFVVVE